MSIKESNEPSSYDDFEPYCKWKYEASILKKDVDILEIQLQGFKFKKEELKYEIGKDGLLYISGEHPVGKKSLIKRFKKKIDVSKYEIKEIEATFEAGRLRLRLPSKKSAFISFRYIRRDNETVGILRLGNKVFNNFVMAVALLLLLAFYMYKYYDCTNFRNWF